MGQAKRRGIFEQREADAQIRNAQIEANIKPHSSADVYRKKFGTQRLATMLTMAGAMTYQDR